jgi:hypothetical protein
MRTISVLAAIALSMAGCVTINVVPHQAADAYYPPYTQTNSYPGGPIVIHPDDAVSHKRLNEIFGMPGWWPDYQAWTNSGHADPFFPMP